MVRSTLYPDELRMAVTRECNGACRHCYNNSGHVADELPAERMIECISEVRALNPAFDRITLTGGEPLLAPEKVLRMSKAARALGIRVRLVTRGWDLTPELCSELHDAGVMRIQFGLDSSGLKAFNDERGNTWDSFHSWLRGDAAGLARTVRGQKYARAAGIDTSVRFSLSRSNLDDLIATYRFAEGLGVSKFKLRTLFPGGRAERFLRPSMVDGATLAQAQYSLILSSRRRKCSIEVTQPCGFLLPSRSELEGGSYPYSAYKEYCPCGTRAAYIDANGDVKYCLFDSDVLGNVRSTPLVDVWNSPSADAARTRRCPLDGSGTACSAFANIYGLHADYSRFEADYRSAVAVLGADINPPTTKEDKRIADPVLLK